MGRLAENRVPDRSTFSLSRHGCSRKGDLQLVLRRRDLKHPAFVNHCAPEVMCLAVDSRKHLVQVPSPVRIALMPLNAPLPDLGREYWTGPVPPEPNCRVADVDPAFEQEILYLPR